jgi:hypothetical protein
MTEIQIDTNATSPAVQLAAMEMSEHGKATWAAVTMHALRPRPEDGCSSTAVVVAADLRKQVAQRRLESRSNDIMSKNKTDEEQKGNIHHILYEA